MSHPAPGWGAVPIGTTALLLYPLSLVLLEPPCYLSPDGAGGQCQGPHVPPGTAPLGAATLIYPDCHHSLSQLLMLGPLLLQDGE